MAQKRDSKKATAPDRKVAKATAPDRKVAKAPVRKTPKPRTPEGPERSGFALLLGRPNVGKSTLLNRLVGEHLAAVSPRPQTTRNRILGIVNRPKTQLCLLDVPGVHRAKSLLNRTMVQQAMNAMSEVDVILYLAEAGWPLKAEAPETVDPVGAFHRDLLTEVGRAKKPTLLVLNKLDLLPKPLLLPVIDAWRKAYDFQEIFPLSALTGENVDGLVDVVRGHLPEGPPLFPPDTITDQPEKTLCAELVREQVFLRTHEEVPYGTAVIVEHFDESERVVEPPEQDEGEGHLFLRGPGLVRIEASIIVERAAHKRIVIGAKGERLREIGTAARRNIERLLGCRVWLGLHVRVVPGWTSKRSMLTELGLDARSIR